MRLCQCRDACWCCKCVENSNLNVTVILDPNWPSTTLGTNAETTFNTTFPGDCLNIGPQRWEWYCHNVNTTLLECCLNVDPQCWEQCCHDVHTMLPECCFDVGWCWPMLWPYCGNVGIWVEIQCWYNIHTFSGHPYNVAGTFKSIYKWTLPQYWDWCWDIVGTNDVTTLPQCWSISWEYPSMLHHHPATVTTAANCPYLAVFPHLPRHFYKRSITPKQNVTHWIPVNVKILLMCQCPLSLLLWMRSR